MMMMMVMTMTIRMMMKYQPAVRAPGTEAVCHDNSDAFSDIHEGTCCISGAAGDCQV
jgi:hypothetical protein